ncbi:bifunctional hydroxymethylpyrimidine kinase/phosphomethylpyrimidine kinase [Moritella sp.]|uniref:bifunctional hydroxymethylpyrimidine kinase/phosphomethylpyrimidine kinase n=1 Tax=Moritella sp. TaxID=78556 RepID=UPI001DC27C7D|nr:bifunctional hydroxymethylpyrimidine kinase/phosphomethylpyrimidine kinase [Moritella sp.]MCJ8351773.1 bifunctional hydroxymethylpyrimidine kinase/phosphomethylpyrimidine kinase [Moritella sp.]NQZ39126.1 bifunctional hydroxymethylpyrimidine kinase/phosphomethylpyrimidine kinase [Moritella sp.]
MLKVTPTDVLSTHSISKNGTSTPISLKQSPSIPIVLTIAGSDSGGGAGIQADIKAISATGSYACTVITAITAQNTLGVSAIFPIPLEHVEKQLDAVFSDLNIVAVKIGMLADSEIIKVVAAKIKQYKPDFLVVDPVMIATSGDLLLQESAISTLKSVLLPLADLITPNLPEGAALIGSDVPTNEDEMGSMISELRQLNVNAVLLKGGHLEQDENSNDLLIFQDHVEQLTAKRINTHNTHGTGCTLSSAIASYLAQGHDLLQAVKLGKKYISNAIAHADELDIGSGHGPVNHFFAGHANV